MRAPNAPEENMMPDKSIASTARLRRLLAELEHIIGDLAYDDRQDNVRSLIQSITETAEEPDDEELAVCAAELYRLRRRRERQFSRDLLGEPCWDMLLDLFANSVRNNPVSVTGACVASNVPTTTALRWLAILEERKLLERYPDPFDRRVVLIRLTEEGLDRMRSMLSEVYNRGFFPREGLGSKVMVRN